VCDVVTTACIAWRVHRHVRSQWLRNELWMEDVRIYEKRLSTTGCCYCRVLTVASVSNQPK